MSPSNLGAALCCGVAVASTTAYGVLGRAAGDLVALPSAVQQMGAVRQGTTTDVRFELHNRTGKAIEILNVGTTCGCTTSHLSSKTIEPGERAHLTLHYSSGESRDAVSAKAIVMWRSDGDGPRPLIVEAAGTIDPDYNISPSRLVFDEGQRATKRLAISPRHLDHLNVLKAVCDKRFFASQVAGDDGEWCVDVTFDPAEYYPDAGPAHVNVYTDSVRQRVASIPLDVSRQHE